MTTRPRKPSSRVLRTTFGLKTGEPGAQIVEVGTERAALDAVSSYRGLYLAGAFPTHLVDVYVHDGSPAGWQKVRAFNFKTDP